MEKWKREYDRIVVPEKGKEKMEEAVMRAKEKKERIRRKRRIRSVGSAAAVFAILLILPNTSRTAAAAMQQIPVLGNFFQVVTIREYQVDEERYQADVKVPEVVPEHMDGMHPGILRVRMAAVLPCGRPDRQLGHGENRGYGRGSCRRVCHGGSGFRSRELYNRRSGKCRARRAWAGNGSFRGSRRTGRERLL